MVKLITKGAGFMDYNNDQYSPKHKKEKSLGWLVPVMLGIIIGVLLSILVVNSNINPLQKETSTTDKSEKDHSQTSKTENLVNVDVTSQITDIVEEVSPSVVGVTNIQHSANFWQQQDGNEAGTGSGVIYKHEDGDAYIVTNHHVIEGADEIEVVLSDETMMEAELLGSDLFSDLAILRTSGEEIERPVEMGTSENLKVGEPAI